MEMCLTEVLTNQKRLSQVHALLVLADREFIPPLSSRGSTTQQSLQDSHGSIDAYFEEMKKQCFVLAMDGNTLAGFMSFKKDYQCEYTPFYPNLYASTCVVHPGYRGQGIMKAFYRAMLLGYPDRGVYTRTWIQNVSHLKVLEKLGFSEFVRLSDHRGPGIHTVYYKRISNGELPL